MNEHKMYTSMLNEDGQYRYVVYDVDNNQYYVVIDDKPYYGYIKDDIFYSPMFHKIVSRKK